MCVSDAAAHTLVADVLRPGEEVETGWTVAGLPDTKLPLRDSEPAAPGGTLGDLLQCRSSFR
jgi:hypothetical protein